MSGDAQDHWSRYWQQGHLTSLPHGFKSNYDGEFLDFWNAQFAQLAGGHVVLDVCSGNGSIALLAQAFSTSNRLDLVVKALDAATITSAPLLAANPAWARHVHAIEFIDNTPLEQLALPSSSVDLVTSQFGIEYTDWTVAAAAIFRVLKPGAHFALVCHTPESKILREMEQQCGDYDKLFELEVFDGGLLSAVGNTAPDEVRGRLNRGLDNIYRLFERNRASAVLSGIGRTLDNILKQSGTDFATAMRNYAQLQQQVELSRGIARDLLGVHLALRDTPRWHEVFVTAGMERLDAGEIRYGTGEIAGHYHRFARPP